jgi:opacity protein-like surface antigen
MRTAVFLSLIAIVVLLAMPTTAGAQMALGWQSSSSVEGISLKKEVSPTITLQGVVGYVSLKIDDPEIEEGGHTEKLDMTLGVSAWVVGARGLFTLIEHEHMDVYAGGGLSYYLLGADLAMGGDNAELSGSALGFNLVTGVEFRFQELPNLAFNSEIGFNYIGLNDMDVETDYGDATLSPNTSMKNFFLGGGIHYYF